MNHEHPEPNPEGTSHPRMFPADWPVVRLADAADKVSVGIASAATFAYRRAGVPLLRNQNIKRGAIDESDLLYVSDEYDRAFATKRLKANDLLTTRTGYPGITCVVPDRYDRAQSFTTLITRPKSDVVCSEYLCQYINSELGQRFFEQAQIGGAQKNVNAGSLREMPVPLPALSEQRSIVIVLGALDRLVEGLGAALSKKRDLKQAAMHQLLTEKRRLVGFSRGWRTRRLGDLADILGGSTPSTTNPSFWNGQISWCTPTDVSALQGRKYIRETARTITALGLTTSAADLIPVGSVIMTSRATIGECAINTVPLATNQGFKNFVPRENVSAEFLYYLLQTKKKEFVALCSGSTFLEIGKSQLRAFEVRVPDKDEQLAIAGALSCMDAEISAVESRLAKAVTLKQAMMQQLLTGRIRLI